VRRSGSSADVGNPPPLPPFSFGKLSCYFVPCKLYCNCCNLYSGLLDVFISEVVVSKREQHTIVVAVRCGVRTLRANSLSFVAPSRARTRRIIAVDDGFTLWFFL
jgi:hypothetical protein